MLAWQLRARGPSFGAYLVPGEHRSPLSSAFLLITPRGKTRVRSCLPAHLSWGQSLIPSLVLHWKVPPVFFCVPFCPRRETDDVWVWGTGVFWAHLSAGSGNTGLSRKT